MWQSRSNRQAGFAVVWVLAVIIALGSIVAGLMQLTQINLRSALFEQDRVRALDYAESGVEYGIAWLEKWLADEPDDLAGVPEDYKNGAILAENVGGFRELTIEPHYVDGEHAGYRVSAEGYYVRVPREQTRRIEVTLRLIGTGGGGGQTLFHTHCTEPGSAPEGDACEPPEERVDIGWPVVEPISPPDICDEVLTPEGEPECRLGDDDYILDGGGLPDGSFPPDTKIKIDRKMHITSSRRFSVQNSDVYVGEDLILDGNASFAMDGGLLYVGRDATFTASGKATLSGGTTIFVNGDLEISGHASIQMNDGVVFYVNGSVTIVGSGKLSGESGEDAPWNIVYVGKSLTMSGNPQVGGSESLHVANVVFLLSTNAENDDYAVTIDNGTLYGGIYAPTRKIDLRGGNPTIHGSLVGEKVDVRPWQVAPIKRNFEAVEERITSFEVPEYGGGPGGGDPSIGTGGLKMIHWQECQSLGQCR